MKTDLKNKLTEAFSNEPETKINIPDFIPTDNHELINNFVNYSIKNLDIDVDDLPEITFTENRDIAPSMTTGAYLPETNQLYVLVKNRALCDYLKTLAHELTHCKQYLEGRIPEDLNERDLKLESEANTLAGDIVYNFAHEDEKNQSIYDLH